MTAQPHVAVVLNPVKRDAERARSLVSELWAASGEDAERLRFIETTVDDAGHSAAREAMHWGATTVIAAGGDGTVRAVAEELVKASNDASALGILPLGTGNLLARNLGVDVDHLESASRAALGTETEPIDVLDLTLVRADRSTDRTYSLVASGLGIDAEVMESTNEGLKKVVGPAAYAATGVTKMLGLRRHPVRISVDKGAWETERVRTVMLVNAGYIQGGIQYAPGSRHDDGVQNAVTMTPRGVVGWVQVAAKMLLRLPKDVPAVSYREGERIRVRCFYPVQAQVDGDPVGPVIGVDSVVLHHALRVHVPHELERLAPGGPLAKLLPEDYAPRSLWARGRSMVGNGVGSARAALKL